MPTFKDGINAGIIIERDRIIQLLLDHEYPKDAYVGPHMIDINALIKLIEEKND